MKRHVFIFIGIILSFFVKAQSDSIKLAELKFEMLIYNFDTIDFEKPVSYIFKFKNVGKADLIIKNVIVYCKCTTTDWSKIPIKRNKKGFLKITFNAGTKGEFYKTIIVNTNGKNANQSLTIKGFVR
jgi:hypothetical protein